MNNLVKRIAWRTRFRKKLCMVPCHSCIVVIFMGFAGAKRWREGRCSIHHIWGGRGGGEGISHKGGGSNFMGRVDPFRHHDRVNNQLINSKCICENEFRYEEVAVMK